MPAPLPAPPRRRRIERRGDLRIGISGGGYEPWRGVFCPKGGRDVFCFFDNTDVKLRAPADARGLMERLGQARAYDPAALAALLRRNGR